MMIAAWASWVPAVSVLCRPQSDKSENHGVCKFPLGHTLQHQTPESSVYIGIPNIITYIEYTGSQDVRKWYKKERALLRVCGQLTGEPPTSWSTSVHFRQLDTETRPAV